jgi:hypothetical protein
MARRSPPRKVTYFEPVPPRLAHNTIIESTFEVGRRFARESAAAIPMSSLAFLAAWGQSGASGCRTITHWQLGAGFLAFSRSCK